jgi:site-specific DNA recombinase
MIAGYVRVSTQDQAEYGRSIEIQKESIKDYGTKNGLKIDRFYEEHGVSGSLADRPALAELQADVKRGLIKTIIITRLDRLARELLLQESILGDFQEKGAQIISIDEPDILSIDPSRILLRQMKGAINQYEKAMITLRMKSGRIKKAKEGGYAGGTPCLGYKPVKDSNKSSSYLKILPEESRIITIIYELRERGKTLQEIADYLNSGNFKTKRHRSWHKSTIKYILDNKTYYGQLQYSAIELDGTHEPIVDEIISLPPEYPLKNKALYIIQEEKNKGASFRQIATKLNMNEIPTRRGGKWKAGTVKYFWDMCFEQD